MADEGVDLRIRTRGAPQAAREVRSVAGAVGALGPAARSASTHLNTMASRGLGGLQRQARYGALALGVLGASVVRMGFQFNASMEQNRIAFTNFLGSGEAAQGMLSDLFTLAKRTPFEFPQLVEASTKLMGFGMSAARTRSLLATLGDTVAGVGGGPEQIAAATTALGQMQAKGKVSAEELLQLTEARIPAIKILKDELHLTGDQIANIGNLGISSGRAIAALQRGLDKQFGGQAAKQANTWTGQISTLHDNLAQLSGSIVEPLQDKLAHGVLPALNASLERVNALFGRKDLDLGDKLRLGSADLRQTLRPFERELGEAIHRADVPRLIGQGIERGAPVIGESLAHATPTIFWSFLRAWSSMGPGGKMFSLAVLGARLGVFSAVAKLALGRFLSGWGRPALPCLPCEGPPGAPGGRRGKGGTGGRGGGVGRAGRLAGLGATALAFGRFAGPVGAFIGASGLAGGPFGSEAGLSPAEERRRTRRGGGLTGDQTVAYFRRHRGELTPDVLAALTLSQRRALRVRTSAPGARGGQPVQIHTHVELNKRELAKAVNSYNLDEEARGRRPRGR